jgi:hypothetical protein
MKEKKEEEKKEERVEKSFATLRLRRVAGGLELYVRAPTLVEFFRKLVESGILEVREVSSGPLQGHKAFYRVDGKDVNIDLKDENSWKGLIWSINDGLMKDGYINMSFLRIVGIKEGMSFIFSGVYSMTQLKNITEKMKEALKLLYREYLKEIEIEITVNEKIIQGGAT